MATGKRDDPYAAFNFLITIDGIAGIVAGFSEVSGLNTETDVIEYRTGAMDITVIKLPGLKKYGDITLKRGYTDNTELWTWRNNIVNGVADRRDGSVVLMDEERKDVLRWNFTAGWVHKIDGPTFNAKGNEVSMETVEIVVESLTLA